MQILEMLYTHAKGYSSTKMRQVVMLLEVNVKPICTLGTLTIRQTRTGSERPINSEGAESHQSAQNMPPFLKDGIRPRTKLIFDLLQGVSAL
jgi:hypothetical protein